MYLKCRNLVIFSSVEKEDLIIRFAPKFEFVNMYSFTTFRHSPSLSWSLRITAPTEAFMSMLALEPTFLRLLDGRTGSDHQYCVWRFGSRKFRSR
jgi:hypothetical protein